MPLLRTIVIEPAAGRQVPPPAWNHLHGLSCRLVGETAGEHRPHGPKPWSVAVAPEGPRGRLRLRLHLLDDTRPAAPAPPPQVNVGTTAYHVLTVDETEIPTATLLTVAPARAVRMWHLSPTTLSLATSPLAGGGRSPKRYLPVPEPTTIYRGLARRWNAFASKTHAAHRVPDDLIEEMLCRVALVSQRTHTVVADIDKGSRPGFVGEVVYTLTGLQAHPAVQQAFTTLSAYAEYCGVGSQTTHGLGAVEVAFTDG